LLTSPKWLLWGGELGIGNWENSRFW
jgi:hypothetical protein